MRSLSRIADFLREEGLGNALGRAASEMAGVVFVRRTALIMTSEHDDPSPSGGKGSRAREITRAEALDQLSVLYVDPPLIDARMDRGDRLIGVMEGRSLAAYAWLSTGSEWLESVERTLEVPEGAAYVYNVRTRRAHRGQGLFGEVIAGARAACAAAGIRRLITVVEQGNASSRRAFEKAGFVVTSADALTRVLFWSHRRSIDVREMSRR